MLQLYWAQASIQTSLSHFPNILQSASLQILLANYIHPEATLKTSHFSTPSLGQHCWQQDVNSTVLFVLFKVSKSTTRSNFKDWIFNIL